MSFAFLPIEAVFALDIEESRKLQCCVHIVTVVFEDQEHIAMPVTVMALTQQERPATLLTGFAWR